MTGSPAHRHMRLLVAEDAARLVGCVRSGVFADTSHAGRARGLRAACTSNDSGNATALAVNRRRGQRPCATERRYVRDLTDRT